MRVVSPAERTDAVLGVLHGQAGATHIVLQRGTAVRPAGDLVEADVAREAADDVLAELSALGIDCSGGITVTSIDTHPVRRR